MMRELGGGLGLAHYMGWHDVWLWAQHLGEGSAVWRAQHPEEAAWASDLHRAQMLADLIDATLAVARVTAQAHSKHRLPPTKPYPRPWANEEGQHIGADAISIADFERWYYQQDEEVGDG